MRRIVAVGFFVLAFAIPLRAQLVVIDPGNLAQAVLIADRTLREFNTLLAQYQTIVRMAQGLGNLDAYRIPAISLPLKTRAMGVRTDRGCRLTAATPPAEPMQVAAATRGRAHCFTRPPAARGGRRAYATIAEYRLGRADGRSPGRAGPWLQRSLAGGCQRAGARRCEHCAWVPRNDGRSRQDLRRPAPGRTSRHGR